MIDEKEVEDIWAEWDDKAQRTMNLEPLHFDWMDALETITELRSELNATDGEKFTDRDRTISELSKENAELKMENERRLVQFEELVQKLERLQTVSTAAKVMCKDQSRTYDEGQIQFKALKAALAALDAPHAGEEE